MRLNFREMRFKGLSLQRNPIGWLLLVGIFLIASIAIGTTISIFDSRQRALEKSGRELDNTVLLLARHFDQQLTDFANAQDQVMRRIAAMGVEQPETLTFRLSDKLEHNFLKAIITGRRRQC